MKTGWLVACLCAEWCSSCREYRPVFENAAREAAAQEARFAWIDIEDHPDVMGEREAESFPTLLIANGDEVAFFGPVMPHPSTLASLVRRARLGQLSSVEDRAIVQLARRAQAHARD